MWSSLADRRSLRAAGFPITTWARCRAPLYVALVLAVTAGGYALARSDRLSSVISAGDAKDAAALALAVGAILVGYQQWRDARHEASLEKYYDRLALREVWRSDPYVAYVFAELDTLEYVIEKYKLGYASAALAARAVAAFRARCVDAEAPEDGSRFRMEVRKWAYTRDVGYHLTTRRVVATVVDAYPLTSAPKH